MKTVLFSLVAGFGLMLSLNSAAQNVDSKPATVQQPVQTRAFVDTNKDGVCDNYATRPANGRGRNFTDTNKDGVCDRYIQGGRKGNGSGQGFGRCNGQGRGQGMRGGRGWRASQWQPAITTPANPVK